MIGIIVVAYLSVEAGTFSSRFVSKSDGVLSVVERAIVPIVSKFAADVILQRSSDRFTVSALPLFM